MLFGDSWARAVGGGDREPYPFQRSFADAVVPSAIRAPTGLGSRNQSQAIRASQLIFSSGSPSHTATRTIVKITVHVAQRIRMPAKDEKPPPSSRRDEPSGERSSLRNRSSNRWNFMPFPLATQSPTTRCPGKRPHPSSQSKQRVFATVSMGPRQDRRGSWYAKTRGRDHYHPSMGPHWCTEVLKGSLRMATLQRCYDASMVKRP